MESWLQDCLHRVQWTLPTHRKLSYGKTRPHDVKGVLHKLPIKLWNVNTMFGRAGKCINHHVNLPTIPLNIT